PDPGIHGCSGWLLRQWGQANELKVINSNLATGKIEGDRKWFINKLGMTFSLISVNGSQPSEELKESFAVGAFEVTPDQYGRVMGTNPSKFKEQGPTAPVEGVSWFDAVAFCNKLSEREGKSAYYKIDGETVTILGGAGYRLPTEAEWEYAGRAGTTTDFSFGKDAGRLADYGWFLDNGAKKSHPAGGKPPNGFGLHDVHGNIREWCWSFFDKEPPTDPSRAAHRVLRGGGGSPLRGTVVQRAASSSIPRTAATTWAFVSP
ncbi:MAG: formylglycine-generating enzyme family protein, partial [Planctomycetales bacterium]